MDRKHEELEDAWAKLGLEVQTRRRMEEERDAALEELARLRQAGRVELATVPTFGGEKKPRKRGGYNVAELDVTHEDLRGPPPAWE